MNNQSPEQGWARLDPRTVLVRPVSVLVKLLPAVFGGVVIGSRAGSQLWTGLVTVAVLAGVGVVAYATTRYRVTEEQVELRSGFFTRTRHATPRDRVRTVQATAPPLHRLLGVVRVRIGTGTAAARNSPAELVLDAVSHAELDSLRSALLRRGAPTAGWVPEPERELLRWNPAWALYAPLSTTGLVAVAAALGAGFQTVDQLGISRDGVGTVARAVSGTDPAVLAVATALTLLVLSVVAAVAVHVEGWWGMRLTRSDDASLHVRRGLLTTRSVTVEQARLRGVTVREPLLVRAAGGGRVDAVVSGLAHDEGSVDNAALTPAAPLRTVARVTAAALGVPVTGELTPHPLAARRRRVVRTLVPAVALLAVGVGAAARGALGWWVVPVATVVVPALALALALDRYRSLGHTVTDELLVVRQGSLVRWTTALQRPGIIGITVRRSLFQRRAGLSTVQFTTAAGSGAYELLDVGAVQGLRAAQAAVPGLLRPFLVGGARPGE